MTSTALKPNPYLYYYLTQQSHGSSLPAQKLANYSPEQQVNQHPLSQALSPQPLVKSLLETQPVTQTLLLQQLLMAQSQQQKNENKPSRFLSNLVPKALLSAGGLIILGLMLNRIPQRASKFELLSTRPEDWAKMVLGIVTLDKLNEGLGVKPQPWVKALEIISILSVMTHGVNIKRMKHVPLLAITIAPLAQATQWVTQKTEEMLEKRNSSIPKWVPKFLIGTLATVGGLFGIRALMNTSAYSKNVIGTEAGIVCVNCGEAHFICTNEIGDIIGSMGGSMKDKLKPEKVTA